MRIVAISDIHGQLPKDIPKCDLVLIAGDICPFSYLNVQLQWLKYEFKSWLDKFNVPVVGIAGNHDAPFAECPQKIPNLKWHYLQDSYTKINGLKIYGTPWSTMYGNWSFMLEESQLVLKWNAIPDDTDIIIVHGPPRHFGDWAKRGLHVGSPTLTARIAEIKPKLVVFGHVHEDRGEWDYNGTKLANVSLSDGWHKVTNDPWEYELDDDSLLV